MIPEYCCKNDTENLLALKDARREGTPLYGLYGDVHAVQGMLFYLPALIDGVCNFAPQCTCPLSKAGL